MLTAALGMAFSNEVVFLSHQLQFAFLLMIFGSLITHELHKSQQRLAIWVFVAALLITADPLRHVIYDAQFNPAACGPPGKLMSREGFKQLTPICRICMVIGNGMLIASMFRVTLSSALSKVLGEEETKAS
eukprot:TRINITY_DN31869_c0_g1_i1.p1 TRINITY_DN31869_c0_g1~~TRINITY_DN31869_c0_g1_i1.p1  ORF type:complete len:131 (-),score=26.20 TRINITY_DN31869_c0_g1_i1:97-489(-)